MLYRVQITEPAIHDLHDEADVNNRQSAFLLRALLWNVADFPSCFTGPFLIHPTLKRSDKNGTVASRNTCRKEHEKQCPVRLGPQHMTGHTIT